VPRITKPKSITAEAEEIVNGDRRQDYGEVKDSFERFALAWTGYLRNKLKPDEVITSNDVAMLNVIGKAIREGNKLKRDNRVDIVGYAILADKLCQ
jgi:hypothetical protein